MFYLRPLYDGYLLPLTEDYASPGIAFNTPPVGGAPPNVHSETCVIRLLLNIQSFRGTPPWLDPSGWDGSHYPVDVHHCHFASSARDRYDTFSFQPSSSDFLDKSLRTTCVADMPHRRRLRSASTEQLDVPTCRRSTIGGRAFPCWNKGVEWPAKRSYLGLVAVGVQEQAEDILVPPLPRNCLTLNDIFFS